VVGLAIAKPIVPKIHIRNENKIQLSSTAVCARVETATIVHQQTTKISRFHIKYPNH
jgi:hypothetical protein